MTDITVLEQRIEELESRLTQLESRRPGRPAMPIQVSEEGVCGLNPECDSTECENASIYRFQKGCRGWACTRINREYYATYRAQKRGEAEVASKAQDNGQEESADQAE